MHCLLQRNGEKNKKIAKNGVKRLLIHYNNGIIRILNSSVYEY